MKAGKLDQRVLIERPNTTKNEYGEPEPNWTTVATVWAEVSDLTGRELRSGPTNLNSNSRSVKWGSAG